MSGIAAGHLEAIVHRDDAQTVTIELREKGKNLSVGFVEISLVPTGARVLGTHGKDDSEADGFLILHAEVPS
jgi:hypothetical protein